MKITKTNLEGCFIIEPTIHVDERGVFFESYHKRDFEKRIGQRVDFVQDNQSLSKKGVLRGLHFQKGTYAQAKLVRVVKGEVLDVVVDIRKKSPTFGKHFKMKLSETNNISIFIPRGMAHGFLTLSDEAIFAYKCDNYYQQSAESGICYDDNDLKINWEIPRSEIALSPKDSQLPLLKNLVL